MLVYVLETTYNGGLFFTRKGVGQMRRVMSWALIIAGLLLILSPLIKNGYSIYMQRQLLESVEQSYPQDSEAAAETDVAVLPTPSSAPTPDPAPAVQPNAPVKAVLVLSIPRLNLKTAVVEGVTPRDLGMGPGLYPDSARPGETGNVAIAGHRNVFGSWFRHLNRLGPGDRISITYRGNVYEYSVEKVFIVAENDWSVVAPTDYKALTLTTCDPPGNVIQRLIVRARQVN